MAVRFWISAFRAWLRRNPRRSGVAGAIAAALLATPVAWRLESEERSRLEEIERKDVALATAPYARALSGALNRKIALHEALGVFTEAHRRKPGFDEEFKTFAAGLHANAPSVRAFEVMPEGIIRHVFPIPGNESVVGRNVFEHPHEEVRRDLRRAIDHRRLTLTGPLELWQGGAGFVVRHAVFERDRFWGFVTTVIDLEKLLEESGLIPGPTEFRWALRDARQRVFFGDASVFSAVPVVHNLRLRDGEWELAFVPARGWGRQSGPALRWIRIALALTVVFLGAAAYAVTERVGRMSQAMEAREQEYRAVLDALPSIVTEVGPDARYRFSNRARAEWFGAAGDELVGKRIDEQHDPLIVAQLEQELTAALHGVRASKEICVPHPVKGLRRMQVDLIPKRNSHGKLDGVYILGVDVTRPREAEEERNRFFMLSSDLLCVASMQGHFKTLNPTWKQALGYEPDELGAQPLLDFVHPDDRKAAEEALHRLATQKQIVRFETRFRAAAGNYRWLMWNAAPSPEEGLFYAVARDVTDYRQLEEQLRESQRMETVGRLAGGIAHDFNNLLTVINGYSALLLARLSQDDRARPGLEEIQKAGARAAKLTQQLLAFSRKQILQLSVICLNTVIEEMRGVLRKVIGENVELVTDLAPDLGWIRADVSQLQLVLTNLAANARDAMPSGGRFTIRTANVEISSEERAEFSEVEPGSYVLCSVSDTGSGMDEETKAHLFEPFFTTKPFGSSAGLGLATVYGIVRQSQGWIRVNSELGKGSDFRIYFPRSEALPGGTDLPARTAENPERETILVVEDQPDVRRLAARILAARGYTVLQAEDGASALAVARRHSGPIHLLLTDVIMPGITGLELAKRFRALYPDCAVLLMSGYPGEAGEIGLRKPFTPEELEQAVRATLAQAR